ncbi:MAG: hypothetical protein IJT69_04380 [Clostridia bacterium]|nr:hypothetical protein [Clostridia bacterium]
MKHLRRSVFCTLIAIALLFLFVCACACNEADFYEQYGELIVGELSEADPPSGSVATDQGSVDTPSGNGGAVTSDETDTSSDESVDDEGGASEESKTEESPASETPTVEGAEQPTSDEEPPAETETTPTTGEEPTTPVEGTTTVEDQAPDGQSTVIEEQTNGAGTPSTKEESEQSGETGADGDSTEEQGIDYGTIFDLTVENGGLYRYVFGEGSKNYPVYVGTREIGKAAFVAGGTIRFDCDFEQEEREVWGTWDENDNLILYVRFEELSDPFHKIVLRTSLAEAIQLDLTERDLTVLKKHKAQSADQGADLDQEAEDAPKGETVDPAVPQNEQTTEGKGSPDDGETSSDSGEEGGSSAPDVQGAPVEQGSLDENTDEEVGETLPAESRVAFLWEGVGTAKEVEIIVLSDEEEEYSFRLSGSGEQRALLLERLRPYIIYSDESASLKQYQAEIPLDPIKFNVFVQLIGDGDLFAAQVKVVG